MQTWIIQDNNAGGGMQISQLLNGKVPSGVLQTH